MQTIRLLLALTMAFCVESIALAHHDPGDVTKGKAIQWRGTVAEVSWDGAHVMYRVKVQEASGAVANWQVLAASPRALRIRGIAKGDVRKDDTVTVAGYLNPYSHVVSPVYFQLADGRKLFVGYFQNDAAFAAREVNQ